MWSNFFKAGGWGIYPTSVFGFLLVAAVVVLLLRPDRRFVWLVLSLAVSTLGSGMLGTSIGVIYSFNYLDKVPAGERLAIAALGCAESLHNLVLALLFVVPTGLLAAIAAARAAFARPSRPPTGASA